MKKTSVTRRFRLAASQPVQTRTTSALRVRRYRLVALAERVPAKA